MKANLNLGRISGIKIKVHWTFFILLLWIVFDELKHGATAESIFFNIAFGNIQENEIQKQETEWALQEKLYRDQLL